MYEARQNKEKVSRILLVGKGKKERFQLKSGKSAVPTENSVVQRINAIPAVEASNSVIDEMNEDRLETGLLCGRGDIWIKGHPGEPNDKERDRLRTKSEEAAGDGKYPICHSCGQSYGSTMVVDHQPPDVLASGGYTGRFRFYPQCLDCSNRQGGVVSSYKRRMMTVRNANKRDWATGIPGELFWCK